MALSSFKVLGDMDDDLSVHPIGEVVRRCADPADQALADGDQRNCAPRKDVVVQRQGDAEGSSIRFWSFDVGTGNIETFQMEAAEMPAEGYIGVWLYAQPRGDVGVVNVRAEVLGPKGEALRGPVDLVFDGAKGATSGPLGALSQNEYRAGLVVRVSSEAIGGGWGEALVDVRKFDPERALRNHVQGLLFWPLLTGGLVVGSILCWILWRKGSRATVPKDDICDGGHA